MNIHQINSLCQHFHLGIPLSPPTRIFGGLLHIMWKIETNKGFYAVKQISKDINLTPEIKFSYELSETIAKEFQKNNIPSIPALKCDEIHLFHSENNDFLVYPWLEEKTLEKNQISQKKAETIATLLARMHLLNLFIPQIPEIKYDYYTDKLINDIIEKSINSSLSFSNELLQNKSTILEINRQYKKSIPVLKQTSVVSHGDLDPKNVLWDKDENPFLIDWESARLLNPMQEIINAAIDWSYSDGVINNSIFNLMIASYKKSGGRININSFNEAFNGILGNWLNWLIFNMKISLNLSTNSEEKNTRINQVVNTLKMLLYLIGKKEELKNNI